MHKNICIIEPNELTHWTCISSSQMIPTCTLKQRQIQSYTWDKSVFHISSILIDHYLLKENHRIGKSFLSHTAQQLNILHRSTAEFPQQQRVFKFYSWKILTPREKTTPSINHTRNSSYHHTEEISPYVSPVANSKYVPFLPPWAGVQSCGHKSICICSWRDGVAQSLTYIASMKINRKRCPWN
jgi:hypothetical protein